MADENKETEYDIKINDGDIKDLKDRCDKNKEKFIEQLKMFTDILDKILKDGVISVEFHEKTQIFRDLFNNMEDDLDEMNNELKKQIESYLSDFEKADGDLY